MMIARRAHIITPTLKLLAAVFLQNAPGGLDAESDPCALTPPNCNMLQVVRNNV